MQCTPPPGPLVGRQIKFLDHAFLRKVNELARAAGLDELTIMHGRVLGYLYWTQNRDVYQRDIEETFNITRSSVTGIVKLMEKKGYIRRQRVPGDARLKKLTLTPLGEQSFERSVQVFQQAETLAVQGLTQEQVDTFFSLCETIQKNLGKKEGSHGKNHSVPSQGI